MNPESVPYFQRFTVANMVLAAVLAFARPVIDATTEPPTTIEIERQAAADERPIMIQAVSVEQTSIWDTIDKELERADRASAAIATSGTRQDATGSLPAVQRPARPSEEIPPVERPTVGRD